MWEAVATGRADTNGMGWRGGEKGQVLSYEEGQWENKGQRAVMNGGAVGEEGIESCDEWRAVGEEGTELR